MRIVLDLADGNYAILLDRIRERDALDDFFADDEGPTDEGMEERWETITNRIASIVTGSLTGEARKALHDDRMKREQARLAEEEES